MAGYSLAAGYALFVWWFSTGLIIFLHNLPPRTFRWSMLGGTAVFAICLWRLWSGSADTTVAGAYAAFTYAVLAWGWQEMSFLMRFVHHADAGGARASDARAAATLRAALELGPQLPPARSYPPPPRRDHSLIGSTP